MDADKVIQDLNRRFAAPLPEFYLRRIIFWHDEDKEFEDKLDDILEAFKVQLKPDDINVEDGIAMIAVVGRRMFRSVGTSARICGALASNGVNIRMLNQGTGEINVIVGVEAADFEKAIRAIYAEFVS